MTPDQIQLGIVISATAALGGVFLQNFALRRMINDLRDNLTELQSYQQYQSEQIAELKQATALDRRELLRVIESTTELAEITSRFATAVGDRLENL